jgi:outer membrane protein assembly factor BamB
MSLWPGNLIQIVTTLLTCLAASAGRPAIAEDWPCWRGPRRDGISRETALLKEWPKSGPRQLWRAELSGGFSSVVVTDGRVFTQTKEKNQEVVVCLNAATGKDVWRYRYDCDYGAYRTFTGGGRPQARTGPRATPTVEGDRVYTLGATGVLLCLEARTGKKVWQQDLLKIAGMDVPTHGYCGSPLVVDHCIFINPGGPRGKSIAALDKKEGAVVWQALDDPVGYACPVWAEVGGAFQVIFFTGAGVVGVAPKDGQLLWRFPWKTRPPLHIATPIYADGKVFVSSNYGSGGAVFRLTNKGEPETVWKSLAMQNHFSTSVLYEGHLYGVSEGRLRCVEFQTGTVKWSRAGLGRGSVTLADGHLIALGEHGEMILARALPSEYAEVSRCQIFDTATLTWTAPVVSGGRLFVRSENALLALDLRGENK